MSWVQHAACRGDDPDRWFDRSPFVRRELVETCARCPVAAECDAEARRIDASGGVWAGRWRVEAGHRALKPCGTEAAYQRHRRAGETPCTPCRLAHSARDRQRRVSA